MDFEPYDEYEAEMIKQKSKHVRRLFKVEEEKKPIVTLTNFLVKSAASVLSFFKNKTKVTQPIKKRIVDHPITEPVSEINSMKEEKKGKPFVLLLKDYQPQQQFQSSSDDEDDSGIDSDDLENQLDDDQEVEKPVNKVDAKTEKSISEQNNAPRKRVKLNQEPIYDQYYYSHEMLHCPPEIKRQLDRIEHEALSIIHNEARKIAVESANRCQNDQGELDYQKSKSFTQRTLTQPYITNSSQQFEQLKSVKRSKAARVDKWPLRKKIHLDEDSKSVKDIERLMFAFDASVNKAMNDKRERIRIENERLAQIKRKQIEVEQARIKAAEEQQKRKEEQKKRQDEMQRRMEEMKKRRQEEQEKKKKQKEKEEAEKKITTPPQATQNNQQKSQEAKQRQSEQRNESPRQPSDSITIMNNLRSSAFESPKKIGISKPQENSDKKEQEVPERKVQSPAVSQSSQANNGLFNNSKAPSVSSSVAADKKANPFIKSPTKIFNLGQIINSNKLVSPFSNLNNSTGPNLFMNNGSSVSNNAENKSLKLGVEEQKPPTTTALPGSEQKNSSNFNLFLPQNTTSPSPLFGGVFSNNISPNSSQKGSPNAHPSIKPSSKNSPSIASPHSSVVNNGPENPAADNPVNNIVPQINFMTGLPLIAGSLSSLSSGGGIFAPFPNSGGFFSEGKKNLVEPDAKSTYSDPLNAPIIPDIYGGSKSATLNPFISSIERPLPSLFNSQNPQANNASRKKQTKKNSTRIS